MRNHLDHMLTLPHGSAQAICIPCAQDSRARRGGALAACTHRQSQYRAHAVHGASYHGKRPLQRCVCQVPFSGYGGRQSSLGTVHHNQSPAGAGTCPTMHPLHPSARTTHHMLAAHDASMRHMPLSRQNIAVLLHAEAPSHGIFRAITTVPALRTTQSATLP